MTDRAQDPIHDHSIPEDADISAPDAADPETDELHDATGRRDDADA
ncbi:MULTISPECIES: hypothetical protein [Clavibacter]|uniref:Uncharacterized protein n=1 Tax=Clavibacter michiganensis TaxID=28447 RepID=A0A251YV55_9MICO|nr:MULTISPECIES: hypothetical protein [Clavibacter]MBT1634410.1 hypothetical protein [Clavibacter michiganensis]MDA3805150.1 hypothetical protein [Clavibacter sp. CT19]OUE28059.1 hypothetical protein BFL36_02365 [Clavibacter michiganensis]